MVVKRIDRYVSCSFLLHLAALVCLIGALYASFDLLTRLDEVQEMGPGRALPAVAAYYAYVVPVFLLDIVPALVLVAAGVVLVRMAKARELLTLKANGTSLRRVVAPIFLWTLLISVAVFLVRETLGPDLVRKGEMLSHRIDEKVERQLLLSDSSFKMFVGEYDFERSAMKDVSLLEFYPEGRLKRATQADTGGWLSDGNLLLESVEVQGFDPSGAVTSRARLPSKKIQTDLTPYDLVRAAQKDDEPGILFWTLPALRQQMKRYPAIPYFRVAFHSRLASFFSPIVLLLVGVPCLVGFERAVNSRFLGVIVSILVASALYALTFVFGSMGNTDAISPVLAGWMPTVLIGTGGLWLYGSMHT